MCLLGPDWPGYSKNHVTRTKRNLGILKTAAGGLWWRSIIHARLLYSLLTGHLKRKKLARAHVGAKTKPAVLIQYRYSAPYGANSYYNTCSSRLQ
jgi:hypothetical protein